MPHFRNSGASTTRDPHIGKRSAQAWKAGGEKDESPQGRDWQNAGLGSRQPGRFQRRVVPSKIPTASLDHFSKNRYLCPAMASRHTLTVDQEGITLEDKEKRHPRERFTKQLIKMCRALDKVAQHDFEINDSDEIYKGHMQALQLWVVGSYARGALTCADLDVVVSFTYSGAKPNPRVIQRKFFGALPLLRVYEGTPEENRSGVPFPDAVLIWSNKDTDWQSRIDSIVINPDAGRAPRDVDVIPLRVEQMYLRPGDLEKAVDLHQKGVLEWEFIPIDDAMLQPIPAKGEGTPEHQSYLHTQDLGKKTKELVPAVWRITQEHESDSTWDSAEHEKATLSCGTTLIHIGRPALPLRIFDETRYQRLVLIPHLTARGPNGAWLIRRGPNHPHWPMIEDRTAYYVTYKGMPSHCLHECGFSEVAVLELFKSFTDARDSIFDATPEMLRFFEVRQATGIDLYKVMMGSDVVDYEGEFLALTRAGRRLIEEEYEGCSVDFTLESFMKRLSLITGQT